MSANGPLLVGDEPLDESIRTPRKRRTAGLKVSEGTVVQAIISRLKLYGCVVQANPNEARSAATGRSSKIANTIAGWPDLTVVSPDGRTAFLEVKAPDAKADNAKKKAHWAKQQEVRDMLARMGHVTALVRSQDEACDVLRAAGWRT